MCFCSHKVKFYGIIWKKTEGLISMVVMCSPVTILISWHVWPITTYFATLIGISVPFIPSYNFHTAATPITHTSDPKPSPQNLDNTPAHESSLHPSDSYFDQLSSSPLSNGLPNISIKIQPTVTRSWIESLKPKGFATTHPLWSIVLSTSLPQEPTCFSQTQKSPYLCKLGSMVLILSLQK